MEEFYTYLWLREDGTPYYVGKGKGRRGFTSLGHNVDCPNDESRIIVQTHSSEIDALDAERLLVSFYGRKDLGTGCLRNLTDGGEGLVNAPAIAESNRRRRMVNPTPTALRNRKHREDKAAGKTAKMGSLEYSEKIRLAGLGRTHTQETKDKMSAWGKGRPKSEEHKEKLSKSKTGIKVGPFSEDHKKNLSEAAKLGWIKRKSKGEHA